MPNGSHTGSGAHAPDQEPNINHKSNDSGNDVYNEIDVDTAKPYDTVHDAKVEPKGNKRSNDVYNRIGETAAYDHINFRSVPKQEGNGYNDYDATGHSKQVNAKPKPETDLYNHVNAGYVISTDDDGDYSSTTPKRLAENNSNYSKFQ